MATQIQWPDYLSHLTADSTTEAHIGCPHGVEDDMTCETISFPSLHGWDGSSAANTLTVMMNTALNDLESRGLIAYADCKMHVAHNPTLVGIQEMMQGPRFTAHVREDQRMCVSTVVLSMLNMLFIPSEVSVLIAQMK